MNQNENGRSSALVKLLREIAAIPASPGRTLFPVLLLSLFALAACAPILPDAPAPVVVEEGPAWPPGIEVLASAGDEVEEAQAPEEVSPAEAEPAEEESQAELTVNRAKINVRSGPGTDFQILGNAVEGETFSTTGKTAEGWWRVCCFSGPGDPQGKPNSNAWVSDTVVEPNQTAEALPVLHHLFPEDLAATWKVSYECGSRRCAVSRCEAVSRTEIHNTLDLRWLEINRIVTWEEACGEDSRWPHQIDRIEGTERYPNSTGLFFFNYWIGPSPGVANALFRLDTGEEVEAWCSDEQEAEVAEVSGWTTVYRGLTCHDVRTGMLVSMQYTKRWFFTGEFEGDRYERAYFGDYEIYKVKLDQTNVRLATVNARSPE